MATSFQRLFHPAHVAMAACGHEVGEAASGLPGGVGAGDAGDIKPCLTRNCLQLILDDGHAAVSIMLYGLGFPFWCLIFRQGCLPPERVGVDAFTGPRSRIGLGRHVQRDVRRRPSGSGPL